MVGAGATGTTGSRWSPAGVDNDGTPNAGTVGYVLVTNARTHNGGGQSVLRGSAPVKTQGTACALSTGGVLTDPTTASE